MGEVINLRQARKRKVRADQAKVAEANRAKHGRTLAERRIADMDRAREAARLEGLKLSDEDRQE